MIDYFYNKMKENLEYKDRISKKLLLGIFKRNSYKNLKRPIINRQERVANPNIQLAQPTSIKPPAQNFQNEGEI